MQNDEKKGFQIFSIWSPHINAKIEKLMIYRIIFSERMGRLRKFKGKKSPRRGKSTTQVQFPLSTFSHPTVSICSMVCTRTLTWKLVGWKPSQQKLVTAKAHYFLVGVQPSQRCWTSKDNCITYDYSDLCCFHTLDTFEKTGDGFCALLAYLFVPVFTMGKYFEGRVKRKR
jgi:hypothetical protein